MPTQAERIKEAREARGLTQLQLAEAMVARGGKGSRGAVNNWEHGGGITLENLKVLAAVTGYRVEYLTDGNLPKLVGELPASHIADVTAGRRLAGIRAALCPDLPARLGITSEIMWEAIIGQPSGLDARVAQQVAEKTGLPLGYVQDGDFSGLTLDQATALLAFHSTRP